MPRDGALRFQRWVIISPFTLRSFSYRSGHEVPLRGPLCHWDLAQQHCYSAGLWLRSSHSELDIHQREEGWEGVETFRKRCAGRWPSELWHRSSLPLAPHPLHLCPLTPQKYGFPDFPNFLHWSDQPSPPITWILLCASHRAARLSQAVPIWLNASVIF